MTVAAARLRGRPCSSAHPTGPAGTGRMPVAPIGPRPRSGRGPRRQLLLLVVLVELAALVFLAEALVLALIGLAALLLLLLVEARLATVVLTGFALVLALVIVAHDRVLSPKRRQHRAAARSGA